MDKKVAHITTVHHPLDTRIFYKQCVYMADAGFDVSLITSHFKNIDKSVFYENKIKHFQLRKYKNRFHRIIQGLYDAYKVAKNLKSDIYHIHDPELLIITPFLRKTGAKVIYDMHEDYYTSILQKKYIFKPLRKIIAKVFSYIENFLIRKNNLIIAEKYYKEKHTKGIEILNYPLISFTPLEYSYSHTSKKILYTGNVTEDRGAFIHAKIPELLDEIEVYYVGKCSSTVADKINYLSSNSNRIKIKGIDSYIPRKEIDKEYYQNNWLAGLAIFPPTEHYAKKELTKFFEYMLAGIPIIVSDFPIWREFIEKYRCGIVVEYNDSEQIKDAIRYLMNNPVKGMEMAENGRNAVLYELNWENEAKKLINFYKRILR
ncbi:glycosyltransferase [Paraliobacillus sediminis]|uniref:glycosyltransferase n=1 Tax=Paraliobacillus sediminis TaxID=1885916 RepID=UPI000E3C0385|nr:glycosyltransferase [Paraliobacillus sediminis]